MKDKFIQNFKLNKAVDSNEAGKAISIIDMLPNKITWEYMGKHFEWEDNEKLISLLLKDQRHIAIIESPYSKILNESYIIDGNGIIIWNIKDLLQQKHSFSQVIFYDTYYINDILYFFVVVAGVDYRFCFNLSTGEIGGLIESR